MNVQTENPDFATLLDDLIEAAKMVESCQYALDNTDGYYNMNLQHLQEAKDHLQKLRENVLFVVAHCKSP